MLTIRHPEIMPSVYQPPIGLLPLWIEGAERPKLIIKAPKEAILAAKLMGGFKIYAVPVLVERKRTFGLVTAFFDDADAPLVTYTPLFTEPGINRLRDLLLCTAMDVYIFDENNRELLSYAAGIKCSAATRRFIADAAFPPFDYYWAISSMKQMGTWFSLRTAKHDRAAISITLLNPYLQKTSLSRTCAQRTILTMVVNRSVTPCWRDRSRARSKSATLCSFCTGYSPQNRSITAHCGLLTGRKSLMCLW